MDEEEILFEVGPAKKLASTDDELVAFLKWPTANETTETGQVKGQRRAGSHDQFVRIKSFAATSAFGSVNPLEIKKTRLI